ncbi:MAG TPA: type II CAAX endopeptidase family protein [Roseiflexaceae bacterium]|nr:type II CAAX endopeptidase family protein [Roseiflexaceae bacterium]
MSTIIRSYPAASLLILAMIFGVTPLVAVNAGLLPQGALQLAAFSSSLAGIVLAALEGRKGSVRELLSRFLIWRVGIQWWAFALLFGVITAVAALYLFNIFGGPFVDWSGLKPLSSIVPMIVILTIFAGMGEEFGWRGFALPRLQARHNALVSSLIIGLVWGIWHIPLFLVEGTIQYKWQLEAGLLSAVLGYTAFNIAWSIQYTWVFNNTKGSVLLAAVIHGAVNAWNGYINVYRGHFGGIIAYMVVSVIVSIIIVLLAGATNLSRTNKRNVLELESESLVEVARPVAV